jgi:hypothetical protein
VLADGDRAAVLGGQSGDCGWLPRQRGDDRVDAHVEMCQRQCQGGLEAEHARRCLVEGLFLGLGSMRGMVGGDRVDRAVGESGADRGDVGGRAQRRVHLEQWIEPGEQFVGEREVVGRCFGGDG